MFKIGDVVECICNDNSGPNGGCLGQDELILGKKYVVTQIQENSTEVVNEKGVDCTVHSWRFKLANVDDTLQNLIDRANDGQLALAELHKRREDVITIKDGKPHTTALDLMRTYHEYTNDEYGTGVLKLAKKKDHFKFEPFTVGGHRVFLDGTILHVGCQKFEMAVLEKALYELVVCNGRGSNVSSGDTIYSTRKGLEYKGDVLSWSDAELLYNRLKSVK